MSLLERALKLLDSFNIKHNSYEIINDEDLKYIISITFTSTFPKIFINKKFIVGYTDLSNLSYKFDLL